MFSCHLRKIEPSTFYFFAKFKKKWQKSNSGDSHILLLYSSIQIFAVKWIDLRKINEQEENWGRERTSLSREGNEVGK